MLTPIAPPNHWPTRTTSSTSVTLTAGDATVLCSNSSDATVALPSAATVPHQIYTVKKIGANTATVTLDPSGSETIDGASEYVLYVVGDYVVIQSDGSNWHVIGGYLTPHFCELARESPQTNLDDNTVYKILHDTTRADTGGLADLANSRVIIRRPGKYILEAPAGLNTASQIVPLLQSTIRVNGSAVKIEQEIQNVTTANMTVTAVKTGISLDAGDVIDTTIQFLGVDATKSTLAGLCSLAVTEVR